MSTDKERIVHLKGTPEEIGRAAGRRLGEKLEANIARYLEQRPQNPSAMDTDRFRSEALPILETLPERFRKELTGLAAGAGIPLQRIAEWIAIDLYLYPGCSSFITMIDQHAWIARNNDFLVPETHGFVTIREVDGRIPTMMFGMEGAVFTASGINREQLWLHHHYLPISDTPRPGASSVPGYVLMAEALETCSNINEVERLLDASDRTDGGLWFVTDGKTDEFALIEFSCRDFARHEPKGQNLIGTNHTDHTDPADIGKGSVQRLNRMTELIDAADWSKARLPDAMITILADPAVEQDGEKEYVTVESMIACPAEKTLWYTLGGYPAASCGDWSRIDWPW